MRRHVGRIRKRRSPRKHRRRTIGSAWTVDEMQRVQWAIKDLSRPEHRYNDIIPISVIASRAKVRKGALKNVLRVLEQNDLIDLQIAQDRSSARERLIGHGWPGEGGGWVSYVGRRRP